MIFWGKIVIFHRGFSQKGQAYKIQSIVQIQIETTTKAWIIQNHKSTGSDMGASQGYSVRLRYSVFDFRYSVFDFRYSVFDFRYSVFDFGTLCSTLGTLYSTLGTLCSTFWSIIYVKLKFYWFPKCNWEVATFEHYALLSHGQEITFEHYALLSHGQEITFEHYALLSHGTLCSHFSWNIMLSFLMSTLGTLYSTLGTLCSTLGTLCSTLGTLCSTSVLCVRLKYN
jgi:hypothetical protein